MSRLTLSALGAFAGAVLATGAALAAAEPSGPPKPGPEMAELNPLLGNFRCTGKQNASDFGPAHATRGSASTKADLNGFVLTMRYDENKTKENPAPIHALYQLTYDIAAKLYVAEVFDNMGGHGRLTSKGWDGDKIVWLGDVAMGGQKVGMRDTFTKSKDGLTHQGELQGRDGKFFIIDEEFCKK